MPEVKEPNPPFVVEIVDTKPVEVENPFSGAKTILQPTAVAVYDAIKGAEMLGNMDIKLLSEYTPRNISSYLLTSFWAGALPVNSAVLSSSTLTTNVFLPAKL